MHIDYEEPMTPNTRLYSLDEQNKSLEPDSLSSMLINRYILSWYNNEVFDSNQEIRTIQFLSDMFGKQIHILDIKENDLSQYNKMRTLVWMSQHRKEGYTVFNHLPVVLASRTIDSTEQLVEISSLRYGARLMFFGNSLSIEQMINSPAYASYAFVSYKDAFLPSQEFIDWLASYNVSILYRTSIEYYKISFVCLTSQYIDIDTMIKHIKI